MSVTSLQHIIPQLQVAIGPVILISGIGLLLLTMTNRLGRAIDRARQLAHELAGRTGESRIQTLAQVTILYRRAQTIRWSIMLAVTSALLALGLVITLFVSAFLNWDEGLLISVIFIVCMVSLFASLIAFMCDINLSLHALRLEIKSSDIKPN